MKKSLRKIWKKLLRRGSRQGFPSLLYASAFVDEGIMLQKDGSLVQAMYLGPPDLESCTPPARDSVSEGVGRVLSRLGSGWMLHVVNMRVRSIGYAQKNYFQDATSELVDEIRREKYISKGDHYETVRACFLTYRPQGADHSRFYQFINSKNNKRVNKGLKNAIAYVKTVGSEIRNGLNAIFPVDQMNSAEMLTFLHRYITGTQSNITFPEIPLFIDFLLGAHDFVCGTDPQIDGRYFNDLSMDSFPDHSHSNILQFLDQFPFEYSTSMRFIFLDEQDAVKAIKPIRNAHHNRGIDVQAILGMIWPEWDSIYQNEESQQQAQEADAALNETRAGLKCGYFSSSIVVMHSDKEECLSRLLTIKKLLDNAGFLSRVERINSVENFLGSIPGHGYYNQRKPLLPVTNLSHLMSLSSVWTGLEYNPHPKFKKAPAVIYARTPPCTPFRLHIHCSDTGICSIIGPTGSGKSAFISLLLVQFQRFKNARCFVFDKGYNFYALGKAVGGYHYDILGDDSPSFFPLKDIREDSELRWASTWVEKIVEAQGVSVGPEQRREIYEGLLSLRSCDKPTMSALYTNIQDPQVKLALAPFVTVRNGPMANFFDADQDELKTGRFQVLEIGQLLNGDPKYSTPIIAYLFHAIERTFNGTDPILIALDEAWMILKSKTFVSQFIEWLKVCRAKNVAVVFATHSLSDFEHSDLKKVILDCPTRFFLPNPNADTPNLRKDYEAFGLNSRQIEIISKATPKKEYYYSSPLGNRLIDLDIDDVSLSFIGKTSKKDLQQISKLEADYGDRWPRHWLQAHGLEAAARRWDELYTKLNTREK